MENFIDTICKRTNWDPDKAQKSLQAYYHSRLQELPEWLRILIDIYSKALTEQDLAYLLFKAVSLPATRWDSVVLGALLEVGINVNCSVVDSNFTPLHIAAGFGRYGMVKQLVLAGADVNALDEKGYTPLQINALGRFPDRHIMRLLHHAGAEYDIFVALTLQDDRQLKAILERDPDAANVTDLGQRETPLHRAVKMRDKKLVDLLLLYNADTNAQDMLGNTPLHAAAEVGDPDMAAYLFKRGQATINARNFLGGSPLDVAINCHGWDTAVVHRLRQYGGKRFWEYRTKDWETFIGDLHDYYAERDYELEFAMTDEGDDIKTFKLWHLEKDYCIDKLGRTASGYRPAEAFQALRTVLFPTEEEARILTIRLTEAEGELALRLWVQVPEIAEEVNVSLNGQASLFLI